MTRTTFSFRTVALAGIAMVLLLSAQSCPISIPLLDLTSTSDTCLTIPANITTDTTLQPGGCYRVEESIRVSNGAMLTIPPGVTIKFATDTGLTIESDGRIRAVGTETERITLTRLQNVTDYYWNGLHIRCSNSQDNALEHVTIEYGGWLTHHGWPKTKANLVMTSYANSPSFLKRLVNCTLTKSWGSGFYIDQHSTIETFRANLISFNDSAAGYLYAPGVGMLDDTSVYSDNKTDRVYILGGSVRTDQTWPGIGTKYAMYYNTRVHANLTIAPGATIEFGVGTVLTVTSEGSLSARGTIEKPIVFTGYLGIPAIWGGIYFYNSESTNNYFDYVTIEHGGGEDFFGWEEARTNIVLKGSYLDIGNSTIQHSAGWGIYVRNDSTINNDVLIANTFSDNVLGSVYREPD